MLAGLMGALGQFLRVIVGLKTLASWNAAAAPGSQDSFNAARLLVSLMIGFVAGALAGLALLDAITSITTRSFQVLFGLIAAGYAGTDAIEGFMTTYLPGAKTATPLGTGTGARNGSGRGNRDWRHGNRRRGGRRRRTGRRPSRGNADCHGDDATLGDNTTRRDDGSRSVDGTRRPGRGFTARGRCRRPAGSPVGEDGRPAAAAPEPDHARGVQAGRPRLSRLGSQERSGRGEGQVLGHDRSERLEARAGGVAGLRARIQGIALGPGPSPAGPRRDGRRDSQRSEEVWRGEPAGQPRLGPRG